MRIVSTLGAQRGVRVASRVTETSAIEPKAAPGDDDVVLDAVRAWESSICRQVRRCDIGVRMGVGLELVLVGVQVQFAKGFVRRLISRPNGDFGRDT